MSAFVCLLGFSVGMKWKKGGERGKGGTGRTDFAFFADAALGGGFAVGGGGGEGEGHVVVVFFLGGGRWHCWLRGKVFRGKVCDGFWWMVWRTVGSEVWDEVWNEV